MRGLINLEKNEFRAVGVASSSWVLRRVRGRAGSSKENRGRKLSPQRVTGSPEDVVQPSLPTDGEVAKDGPHNSDQSVTNGLLGYICFRVYTQHQT